MSQTELDQTIHAHQPAILAVSGIPIKQEREQFEKALHRRGGEEFKKKITLRFSEGSDPERRVHLDLEGLSPTLLAWVAEVITQALSDCRHRRYKVSAVLLYC